MGEVRRQGPKWPGMWRCSVCRFTAYLRWAYSQDICPSCGAKDTFKPMAPDAKGEGQLPTMSDLVINILVQTPFPKGDDPQRTALHLLLAVIQLGLVDAGLNWSAQADGDSGTITLKKQ